MTRNQIVQALIDASNILRTATHNCKVSLPPQIFGGLVTHHAANYLQRQMLEHIGRI